MVGLPFILGGGASSAYRITNSLRFRKANSARLERTFAAGNQTTWTVSMWVKRGGFVSDAQHIFSAGGNHPSPAASMGFVNGSGGEQFGFIPNNGSSAAGYIETTPVFRDPTKELHVVVVFNSTLATATDRVKFYFNRRRVTTFNSADWPALNGTTQFNSAVQHRIGHSGWVGQHFDGNISNFTFVNGQELAPETFGEINASTGEWVPKQYIPPIATNNCLLEFKNAASTTTIGNDTSGNGNNWTTSGISVTAGVTFDQSLDTPTNSHAKFSPFSANYKPTLSNANERITTSGASIVGAPVLFDLTQIQAYAELTITTGAANMRFSAGSALSDPTQTFVTGGEFDWGEKNNSGMNWEGASGDVRKNAATVFNAGSYTTGDRLGMATKSDGTNLRIWLRKNGGSWLGSGSPNPATDTDPSVTITLNGPAYMAVGGANGAVMDLNTGQRAFVDTPPTGFFALNTQNLSNPAIPRASNGAVVALDTEANIEATLAAARSGWTDFVEILKNRAAVENWAWRFSHNATHEHAVDSTNTYQTRASRTMSGAQNWVGYAIRIGNTYGTAAGSVSHTNGTATTVTHNLTRARTAILLFPRAGGDVWYYHPDLTAGSLLRLNTNAAQTANTSITGVGSNSFQIGSGVATGTYDYLVMGDVDGFIDLFNYTGNASTSGPFAWTGQSSNVVWLKDRTAVNAHRIYDRARNPFNGSYQSLMLSSGAAEAAENFIDMTAGGMRPIIAGGNGVNDSSSVMCGVAIAFAPFKFATAR
jgi:hypothetical protein